MCSAGSAHIVFWKQRNRYFFGCNASTPDKRCPGPKEWQSIDVPDNLRVNPHAAVSTDAAGASGSAEARKRDREAGEDQASAGFDTSDREHEPNDKEAKRELKRELT